MFQNRGGYGVQYTPVTAVNTNIAPICTTIRTKRAKYQEKRPKAATGAQEESTGHRKAGADRKSSRRGPLCFYTYIRAKKPLAFTISLKRHINILIYNYSK